PGGRPPAPRARAPTRRHRRREWFASRSARPPALGGPAARTRGHGELALGLIAPDVESIQPRRARKRRDRGGPGGEPRGPRGTIAVQPRLEGIELGAAAGRAVTMHHRVEDRVAVELYAELGVAQLDAERVLLGHHRISSSRGARRAHKPSV